MRLYIGLFALMVLVACTEKEPTELPLLESKSSPQVFRITTQKDSILIGEKGTRIKFKSNSFTDLNGKDVNGEILIELNEYYSMKDFIGYRLSTNTVDDKILKSSGMVLLQATKDGEVLQLKDDKPMTILFPKMQKATTANLFSGSTGPYNEIQWNLLEPVHHDTIVRRIETIKSRGEFVEEVIVTLEFIIGTDTVPYNDSDEFKKILDRQPLPIIEAAMDYTNDSLFASFVSIDTAWTDSTWVEPLDPERFYIFETTRLGYLNCDIIIDPTLYMYFDIVLPTRDVDVFVVLDSLKSVVYPRSIVEGEDEFMFTFRVPKDQAVTAVAYRKEGGKHFYGVQKIERAESLLSLELKEESLSKIREEISQLE